MQGTEPLIEHIEKTLGIHCGETTKDGLFTLVRAECLALCGTGPGVMIDDQAIGPEIHPLNGIDIPLRETHLVEGYHPTAAVLDRWIEFLRAEAAKSPRSEERR